MQTTVVTLLLITTSVVFACVVIDYAVNTIQNNLGTTNNPQLDRVRSLENSLMNQTNALNALNGTQLDVPTGPPS